MHPLTGELANLSDEDLLKKINELYGRLRTSMSLGNNQYGPQLRMILEDYQAEYNRRMAVQAEQFAKNNKKLADKIDIE